MNKSGSRESQDDFREKLARRREALKRKGIEQLIILHILCKSTPAHLETMLKDYYSEHKEEVFWKMIELIKYYEGVNILYEIRYYPLLDFGRMGMVKFQATGVDSVVLKISTASNLLPFIDEAQGIKLFNLAKIALFGLANYYSTRLPDASEIREDKGYFRKKNNPGRPHLPDDEWAWEQVFILQRNPAEVYNEWIERPGVVDRNLVLPRRQWDAILKWKPLG